MQIVCKFSTMLPNYKVVLDLRKPKKEGHYPVKIRVTFNRIQKYFPIGIDLEMDDFERIQKGSVRKELRVLKEKITTWEHKAKNLIHQLDPFDFTQFRAKLFNEYSLKIPDVFTLFDIRIEELHRNGKVSTSRIYRDAKNSIKQFKSKLNLSEITPDFLQKYESNMINEGRSSTTISMYTRHLRCIYNRAIDSGFIDRKYYPFGRNKYQTKAPRNIKKSLSFDQIKSIIDYKVKEGTNQQLAKDMWLLSYFCNGMNIKDILHLKFRNIQGENIYFERLKTSSTNPNPRPIIVALIPQTREIIDRWSAQQKSEDDFIFPVLNKSMSEDRKLMVKNQFIKNINDYMKKIGIEIGYDKPLTTYVARHSFATIMKRSGASMEFISESLGHQSLQTTEAYLDSFEDSTRRKFTEMLVPQ